MLYLTFLGGACLGLGTVLISFAMGRYLSRENHISETDHERLLKICELQAGTLSAFSQFLDKRLTDRVESSPNIQRTFGSLNIPREVDGQSPSTSQESTTEEQVSSTQVVEESLETDKTKSTESETSSENTVSEHMKVSTDDVTQMFQEDSRSIEEILDVGRKVGAEPVNYQVRPGGGYATNRELDNFTQLSREFAHKLLKPREEEKILREFSKLHGKNYYYAKSFAQDRGYKLYPLSINSEKMPVAHIYDSTRIGVTVSDSDYDPLTQIISQSAILDRVVNIGAGAKRSVEVRHNYF
jgi:hypothetical protein